MAALPIFVLSIHRSTVAGEEAVAIRDKDRL